METEAQEAIFTEVTTPKMVILLRKYWQILLGVLLLIIIIMVTIKLIPNKKITTPITNKEISAPITTENNNFSNARLELLENKISNLEAQINSLSAAQAELTSSIEQTEAEPTATAEEKTPTISKPVTNEDKPNTAPQQADNQLLYYELKEKLLAGEDFSDPVDKLMSAELTPDAQNALQTLLEAGNKPINTLENLQESFQQARSNWENKPTAKDTANSLATQSLANLKSLVKIRKIGNTHKEMDSESILARAENALQNQDVNLALKELKNLASSEAVYFASWREQAIYQQKILGAFAELRRAILSEKNFKREKHD